MLVSTRTEVKGIGWEARNTMLYHGVHTYLHGARERKARKPTWHRLLAFPFASLEMSQNEGLIHFKGAKIQYLCQQERERVKE